MKRAILDTAIQKIRDYTKDYPELLAAHHFLYDLPLDKNAGKPEFVIMGINPGEVSQDREEHPGPTEETWDFDFHETGKRSSGSKKWKENASFFANGRPLVFTELFFWSSANSIEFKQRFGMLWKSLHMSFCICMNQLLISEYKPKGVIFSGISQTNKIADKYNLKYIHTLKEGNQRILEHYQDSIRPWFFTKHWSA